ncbi:uncharacterized protein LOC130734080 [Lotus japonicus]|uniref:uncharacterized protein LOC130734080 n=1 Tax=Lotus japonicus TaxID=34305 RepID=UPI002590ABD5|nr:uncharacterized protein LOC130734080 [Lotus japonicus]
MGGKTAPPVKEVVSLIDQGKMRIEHENGNRMLPKVVTDPAVIQEMCSPWREALVISLLGKRLGFRTMKARLASVWRLVGDFDLLDIDNGFYMVKFDIAADRAKVMEGGPWMIFDHYLAVATWSKEFLSPLARVTKTLAWIRIPVGRPVRVDSNTLRAERGKFARICVELDLTLPVIGKVCIEGHWHRIEYEGLHVICTSCGCYGHRARECKAAPLAFMPPQPVVATTQVGQIQNPVANGVTVTGMEERERAAAEVSKTDVIMGEDSVGNMGEESAGKIQGNLNVGSAISVMPLPRREITKFLVIGWW